MTNFEWLRKASIDELVAAINLFSDVYIADLFAEEYCHDCEPIHSNKGVVGEGDYAYCELNHHCKYFPELNHIPSDQDLLRFWLNKEREE